MTGPRSQRVESTVISECSMRQDHRTRCKPRRTRGPFSEPLGSRVQLKEGFHLLPNERNKIYCLPLLLELETLRPSR